MVYYSILAVYLPQYNYIAFGGRSLVLYKQHPKRGRIHNPQIFIHDDVMGGDGGGRGARGAGGPGGPGGARVLAGSI